MRKLFFLVLVCFSTQCLARTYPHLLIKKYAVDPTMKAILDEHIEEVLRAMGLKECIKPRCLKGHRAYEFPWLPGYIIKTNIDRVSQFDQFSECIKDNNLDLILFPDKRLYIKRQLLCRSNDN